eukprot:6202087-Pleurochrysis_carterae.AAC.1
MMAMIESGEWVVDKAASVDVEDAERNSSDEEQKQKRKKRTTILDDSDPSDESEQSLHRATDCKRRRSASGVSWIMPVTLRYNERLAYLDLTCSTSSGTELVVEWFRGQTEGQQTK